MAAYFMSADGKFATFHVGESATWNKMVPTIVNIMVIDYVQADCDELAAIIEAWPEVPLARKNGQIAPVQRWFGDTAKFIANAIWR